MTQSWITREQVLAQLAEQGIDVTEQTLYRWIKRGLFPAPIKIAPSIRGWTPNTPGDWVKSRMAAGQQTAAA